MTKTNAAKIRARNGRGKMIVVSKPMQKNRRAKDFQISPEYQYFGSKPRLQTYVPIPRRNTGMYSQSITAPVSGGNIINRSAVQPFITTLNDSTLVTNTESIYTIAAVNAFATARMPFTPFQTQWLDGIATNFSKWQWRYLRYIYIPACPTSSTGTITMSPGYDMDDVVATNTNFLMKGFRSVTAPLWAGWEGSSALHNYSDPIPKGAVSVEIDVTAFKGGNELTKYPYISGTTYISNTSSLAHAGISNMYSPGYLDIATELATPPTNGYIFCQYQIELFEPITSQLNDDLPF